MNAIASQKNMFHDENSDIRYSERRLCMTTKKIKLERN